MACSGRLIYDVAIDSRFDLYQSHVQQHRCKVVKAGTHCSVIAQ